MDVWEDLASIVEMHKNFRVAHIICPKSIVVCNRLGIVGFPTLSVLDGAYIYDY